MKLFKNILVVLLVFSASIGYGQKYTTKAYSLYQAGTYVEAQAYADSAIVSNERFNSQLWQLRGLIYRKLEQTVGEKEYRDIAIESFVQARTLDEEGKYKDKIDGYLKNTVIRYYNGAVTALEEKNLEEAENSYNQYKEKQQKYVDQAADFKESDIQFYTALGSEYLKLVSTLHGEEKTKQTAKGINFFQTVLELNKDIFGPNLNVGVMYYNNGADLLMNMDPLTPIEEIPVIEEKAQEYFRKALPYLLEANRIDPSRMDVIEAITGCYYGLQDDDNYDKYQKLLDEKNLPSLLEKHKSTPKNIEVLSELLRIYSTTFKDEEKYKKYVEILNKLEE
ncbi:MAG: tetratricopeptide (TPR) repeat protein [Arenicella sp.]|jgi:tetratricopeptide (TPR) repeat protein